MTYRVRHSVDVDELAQAIRSARERKSWTQAQLAAAVGVSRGTVRNWESGTYPRNSLARLEEVLGVSLSDGSVGPAGDTPGALLSLSDELTEGLSERKATELLKRLEGEALRIRRELEGD